MEAGAALVEAITDAGIDVAFTVPGESFLPALEAMRTNKDKIRVISVRQEGGGSLAAHGFGQLTGRPAAVFVSRGLEPRMLQLDYMRLIKTQSL